MVRDQPAVLIPVLPDQQVPNAEIINRCTADLPVTQVHTIPRDAHLLHTALLNEAVHITVTLKEVILVLPTIEVPDPVLPEIHTVQVIPVPTAGLPAAAAVHTLLPAVPAGLPVHPIREAQVGHIALEVREAPAVHIAQAVPAARAGLLLPLLPPEATEGKSTDKYPQMVAGV